MFTTLEEHKLNKSIKLMCWISEQTQPFTDIGKNKIIILLSTALVKDTLNIKRYSCSITFFFVRTRCL